MTDPGQTRCDICKQPAAEVCHDGVCRSCHKSVTWDDCVTGTWNARKLLSLGRTRDEILKLYPDARI